MKFFIDTANTMLVLCPGERHVVSGGCFSQAKMLNKYVEVHQVLHLSCPNRDELARRMRKRARRVRRMHEWHLGELLDHLRQRCELTFGEYR